MKYEANRAKGDVKVNTRETKAHRFAEAVDSQIARLGTEST